MSGQDGMHLEGGGTIPKEGKDMLREHIEVEKLYTFDQAQAALQSLKQEYPICRIVLLVTVP